MIFLTVGTQLPFNRLTRAVDNWCRASGRGPEVFGQVGRLGPDDHVPQNFQYVERMHHEEFETRMRTADLIIAHAGMGAIIGAALACTPILIMPRHAELGEQRNDHQIATVHHFSNRSGILVADDEAALAQRLSEIEGTSFKDIPRAIEPFADSDFVAALRDYIQGERD